MSLDIGAGRKRGCDVNVDLNRDYHPDVVCDAEHLPFKTEVFRKIVCSHVLEHLTRPDKCLREIRRVASEDAKVLVGFPLEHNASNCACHFRVLLFNLCLPSLPIVCLGILRDLRLLNGRKAYVAWHKWRLTPEYVGKFLRVEAVNRVGSYWSVLLFLKKVKLPKRLRHILANCGPKHSYLLICRLS